MNRAKRLLVISLIAAAFTGCKTINRVPDSKTLYFVGAFTDWRFEAMRRDEANPARFKMGRVMPWKGSGNFKFGSDPSSWDNMYHPFVGNASYTYGLVIRDSPEDNAWALKEGECGRAYKMALDTGAWPMSFSMEPFDPWPDVRLSGDAAPAGAFMEAVEGNPFAFSWRGTLMPGALSFACVDGPRIEPWRDGLAPDGTEQQAEFVKTGSGGADAAPGKAWTIEEAGIYLIVLDQLQEYAVILKSGGGE